MKLTAGEINWKHEEMKRENRKPNVYPPPNDGREWILAEDAAVLYGVTHRTMVLKAKKLHMTHTCRHGVKAWLVKKEVMDYLKFLKQRENWRKRRRPKNWIPEVGDLTGMEEERIKQVFWTSRQAAEFLNISIHRVEELARCGKLPVYVTKGVGKGRQQWFSPTNLRNHQEDEERLRWRAVREKGLQTMQQGVVGREVYKMQHRARVYTNIPQGWITVREVADRLQVSIGTVHRLRQRDRLQGEHFTGRWDKRRPWFFHEDSVEEYWASEHYQKTQRKGKEAALSVLVTPESPGLLPSVPYEAKKNHARSELTFGYTKEELTPDWGKMPPRSLEIEW